MYYNLPSEGTWAGPWPSARPPPRHGPLGSLWGTLGVFGPLKPWRQRGRAASRGGCGTECSFFSLRLCGNHEIGKSAVSSIRCPRHGLETWCPDRCMLHKFELTWYYSTSVLFVEAADAGPVLWLGKLLGPGSPGCPGLTVLPQVEGGPADGALAHPDATSILGDVRRPELGLLL